MSDADALAERLAMLEPGRSQATRALARVGEPPVLATPRLPGGTT